MRSLSAASNVIWRDPVEPPAETIRAAGSRILAQILAARTVTGPQDIERFLNAFSQPLGDPYQLPDMHRAIELIEAAIGRGHTIGVFGDYDVDGLSSTAMLTRALRKAGVQVIPTVPHRKLDGYGLNMGAIDSFHDAGTKLLITVDCGTSDRQEIEAALDYNMDVIVIDHHQVHANHALPDEVAFVSPRRSENAYPDENLAAVGVAHAVLRALLGESEAEMYLPYVGLGTIADVVPLLNENRTLAARGIDMLRRWTLPGINTLCREADVKKREISAHTIGYIIGPRLNAAGRMDDPRIALQWFLADSEDEAAKHAAVLERLNRARQADTEQALQEAISIVDAEGGAELLPAIVVSSPDWDIGIAGIVAARLTERYYRPAIVIAEGSDESVGSARSAGIVDMVAALRPSAELLESFGGHTAAAGLSLRTSNIQEFARRFRETVLGMLDGQMPVPEIRPDAEVEHGAIDFATVDSLNLLEPHGAANPRPLMLIRGLDVLSTRWSRNNEHLLLTLGDRLGRRHRAVYFRADDNVARIADGGAIDVACRLKRNTFRGVTNLDIQIEAIRPAL